MNNLKICVCWTQESAEHSTFHLPLESALHLISSVFFPLNLVLSPLSSSFFYNFTFSIHIFKFFIQMFHQNCPIFSQFSIHLFPSFPSSVPSFFHNLSQFFPNSSQCFSIFPSFSQVFPNFSQVSLFPSIFHPFSAHFSQLCHPLPCKHAPRCHAQYRDAGVVVVARVHHDEGRNGQGGGDQDIPLQFTWRFGVAIRCIGKMCRYMYRLYIIYRYLYV